MEHLEVPPPPEYMRGRRRSSVMDFEQSHMLGKYREDLANFALKQAEKLVQLREERSSFDRNGSMASETNKNARYINFARLCFKYGGDMIFFSMLAITLALLSFTMDILVRRFLKLRNYLTTEITEIGFLNFVIWIAFTMIMALISGSITYLVAPQAAGSGISEMKVMLRGVVLKEYLTVKTLFAKIFGLIFTLGSGLPLGKEGPFVHMSSIVANQFMKLFSNITNPQEYESRFMEVIAVACSVGVAVTFASPVGGVLFSIEIVSVFFSVRSYWHGFFAATVGALFWRLLTVWFEYEENITHVFKTDFRLENPYETLEIVSFAVLGVLCGFAGFLFVKLNSIFVKCSRHKNRINEYFKKHPLMYTALITFVFGVVWFPGIFGQYFASWLNTEESIHELFTNFSWHAPQNLTDEQARIIENWRTEHTSVFVNTFLFFAMNLMTVALVTTLPIPYGVIGPSFKIGAGLGRFYGECVTYLFPNGISPYINRTNYPILAGTYAVAGCAGFAGANTGAMSSAVMAFEMTGQVTHLLPVIVTLLSATMTARFLGPSVYDSVIILKKLPYLPSILPSSSTGHQIFVRDFMEKNLLFVWGKCTYRYLRHVLSSNNNKLRIFPFVKSPDNKILLGTVERAELQYLLDDHLSRQRMLYQLRKSMEKLDCEGMTVTQNGRRDNRDSGVSSVETIAWEEEQLDAMVNFSNCPIDPAPFQLMEGASLLKTHNLFSLLGLQQAYVTSLGTLVGVVSLKELRKAIEGMNAGTLPKRRAKSANPKEEIMIDNLS